MTKTLDVKKLTGVQKVAMILLAVREENATKIFSLLGEDEIKNISRAISTIGSIHPSTLQLLLDNLAQSVSSEMMYLSNIKNTEKLLSKVLDKDQVAGLMEEIRGPQGTNTWEKLRHVNEELLASYLKGEHPQTIALVISKLSPDHKKLFREQFNALMNAVRTRNGRFTFKYPSTTDQKVYDKGGLLMDANY